MLQRCSVKNDTIMSENNERAEVEAAQEEEEEVQGAEGHQDNNR